MLERITIRLSKPEREILTTIAEAELRDLCNQVRFILQKDFQKRGYLSDNLKNEQKYEEKLNVK